MDKQTASRLTGGNPEGKRSEVDFYPTPPEATQALLDFINIPAGTTVWEPACGQGHMVEVLERNGLDVAATDLQTGTDFLEAGRPLGVRWIITNPPFSLSEQFIRRAAEHKVPFAFLLKSQYWHAAKRMKLFLEVPPRYILPLTWRPDFKFLERKEGEKGSSLMDVCWCVWDGDPVFTQYIPIRKPEGK